MNSTRRRPSGKEFEELLAKYKKGTHAEKLELATYYGVALDTLKHWVSEGKNDLLSTELKAPSGCMTVDELLGSRPSVNLDFVCFDLETSNLKADFSILLTACIKPFGQPTIVFRADNYPSWTKDRANDKDIVVAIAQELRKHAIVVGHYSVNFDIPFLRAKMAKYGLEPLPQMFGVDTYRIAKSNFAVSSRRLQNLVRFFDVGEKSGVDGDLWMKAAYEGNTEALDEIVKHNIVDVEVLEKLTCISFPYLKSIPKL